MHNDAVEVTLMAMLIKQNSSIKFNLCTIYKASIFFAQNQRGYIIFEFYN